MPIVLIQHKNGRGLNEVAEELSKEFPAIVAPALSVPGGEGELRFDDIEVWVTEGSTADVNTKDLEIIIWAHEYPERKANLEERKDIIVKDVRTFLADYDRNVTGFVWILLQPTAFGKL
ncbi:MAG: hypothetical protein WAV50_00140 [Minisyncoccia bacterium]